MNRSVLLTCSCWIATQAILAVVASADETAQYILLEAEDYTGKQPADEAFARPVREYAASNRAVLAAFFNGQHVVYEFELPTRATYTGWLRYASNRGMNLKVAVDPKAEPKFKKATLPATGGLAGPDVWRWEKIFQASLASGPHKLAIGSAGFRPDCIFISASNEQPTDEVIRSYTPPPLDEATRKLLEKPVVSIRPDWLDGASEYRLPSWYDECRVQAHTRLGATHMTRDIFLKAARGFHEMGVRTFVRHVQGHTLGAWWPSTVGTIHPMAENRNLAKEIVDNAHREGCRVIVYHVHMYNRVLAQAHPDWICRHANGKPVQHGQLDFLCFNSPYSDQYLTRALELVDLGVDGFYFDYVHMPKTGCWCDYCKKKFKTATGLDHPSQTDPEDPVWRKLVEFNNHTIETTFSKWRKAIHERNPELVMLISSHVWTSMTDHHLNNRLFRIADSVKMEFSIPIRLGPDRIFSIDTTMAEPEADARLALGYTLARDAADGRPSHIWTHGLLNEEATLYATAGMVAHGNIANLDVAEATIPNSMFKKAFALGDQVSPHFAGTVPYRWAAIHFAESARNALAPDESRQWKEVLYPVFGAYRTLLRSHLPVGIVTDSQLEEGLLDGVQVLFLPAPQHLTLKMRTVVDSFRNRGGSIIEQDPTWRWYDSNGGSRHATSTFQTALNRVAEPAAVKVQGGPETMHSVCYRHRDVDRWTIALANNFAWVYTGRAPKGEVASTLTKIPPPCRGVTLTIRRNQMPRRLFEAVSNKPLVARMTPDGLRINVPAFEHMAVVVVEFGD